MKLLTIVLAILLAFNVVAKDVVSVIYYIRVVVYLCRLFTFNSLLSYKFCSHDMSLKLDYDPRHMHYPYTPFIFSHISSPNIEVKATVK